MDGASTNSSGTSTPAMQQEKSGTQKRLVYRTNPVFSVSSYHSWIKQRLLLYHDLIRFDFLLKQTELFSHFMGTGKNAKTPTKAGAPKTASKAASKKGKEGDNR